MAEFIESNVTHPYFEGWCTIDDGVNISLYDAIHKALDYLYAAMVFAYEIGEAHYEELKICFPSGLVVYLIKDWTVPDFRIGAKRFWAIEFNIMGAHLYAPLPKIDWVGIEQYIFRTLDVQISGSEYCYYLIPGTDEVQLGTEFSPVRRYRVLTDGLRDFGPYVFAIALIYILYKLGLIQAAWHMIKSIWGFVVNYHHRHLERDIMSELRDMKDKMDFMNPNVSTEDDIRDQLLQIESTLRDVSIKVGLRYLLK